ncbi:hypothetical protein SYNPS1DRAFT_20487 [Syncephalis pseudoplumigaleata]|uniref:Uncharacterized protein n=6 Tax=cellular organisms TaxID=131567 RepID=A0A4P9Z8V0_9FUNG|nr:hypothetical protein SYNPS1DRAFT_20487 [Syncephalis pseudoplumigaleata]|eukprot:RKP28180.1 hypothetical protein SYNPS1DRAFT_20487 [Syncephalis pseudoplumigaleata]
MQRLKPLPKPARSDAVLAAVFLENATVKAAAAEWAADQGFDNQALHAIAIAIELLLKSYLLNVATDDVWNRANIGHDLAKALHYSAQAGLALRMTQVRSHGSSRRQYGFTNRGDGPPLETGAGSMSFPDAHAFAFSLATTLMAVIVIFRAGDGTLSVTPANEYDGDVSEIVHEVDPFAP